MSQIVRNIPGDWASTTNSAMVAIFPIQFIAVNPPEPIKVDEKTPNEVTIQAMSDVRAGKNLVRCESAADMFRKLGDLISGPRRVWMLKATYAKQFERDLKRMEKRGKDLEKIEAVIMLICDEQPLLERHKDHALKGS